VLAVVVLGLLGVGASQGRAETRSACGKTVELRQMELIATGTAAIDKSFPDPDGSPDSILADGHGGWFVGGRFTCIGGVSRRGIAHLNADGTLDTAWHAQVPIDRHDPDPYDVLVLARIGSTLYAGGPFGVEAVDAVSGTRRWLTRVSGNPVDALAANSQRVYVGGSFDKVGGTLHRSLVALSPRTGAVLPWHAPTLVQKFGQSTMPGPVGALALDGGRLFVGGDMTSVNGKPRFSLAALDARTGALTDWVARKGMSGDVGSILVTHGRVFVSGLDTYAVIDEQTGALDPLTQGTGGWRFAVSGDTLYLAGNCHNTLTRVLGLPRNNLAAVDLASGRVTSWAPNLSKYVCTDAIAADAAQVLVIGSFSATLG
jgi:trimeric autotransporter adhesin